MSRVDGEKQPTDLLAREALRSAVIDPAIVRWRYPLPTLRWPELCPSIGLPHAMRAAAE